MFDLIVRGGRVIDPASNLTAVKARIPLMACLIKFGMLPPAAAPDRPTDAERQAMMATLADYQIIFDTH